MFSVAKRTFTHLDPFALGSLRYLIGVAVLAVLLWALEGRQAFRYGTRLWPAIGVGVAGITGFNTLVWYGLTYTRPEYASILMAMQTPLTALALWLLHGQRPQAFTLACVTAAIAGVLLVVTKGDPASVAAGGSLVGDLLVLLGAVCWVAYTLSVGRFVGWSSLRMTTLTCIPGGIGLLLVNALAVGGGAASVPEAADVAAVWLQVIYFAFGSVVLGVFSFNAAVRHLGALNAMLMLNLIPVCVFAIEAALGRRYASVEIAGALLVIGALAVNNLMLRRLAPARQSTP